MQGTGSPNQIHRDFMRRRPLRFHLRIIGDSDYISQQAHLYEALLGMLTCADTVIWAPREVFFYEYDFYRRRKRRSGPTFLKTQPCRSSPSAPCCSGLVMTVILGAANAYLGLRAGMTIAATYPAAVIGMAVLRVMKGSILEENIARTVGSIGESVAAGAIFTIPGIRDLRRVAGVRLPACVLEVVDPDAGRRHAGNSLRHLAAPRDGRRPRASLPGIGGRIADSHRRTAGQPRREDSVRQHGIRRARVPAGPVQPVQPQQRFLRQRRRPGQELRAHGTLGDRSQAELPEQRQRFRRRPSARRILASATSSARAWHR